MELKPDPIQKLSRGKDLGSFTTPGGLRRELLKRAGTSPSAGSGENPAKPEPKPSRVQERQSEPNPEPFREQDSQTVPEQTPRPVDEAPQLEQPFPAATTDPLVPAYPGDVPNDPAPEAPETEAGEARDVPKSSRRKLWVALILLGAFLLGTVLGVIAYEMRHGIEAGSEPETEQTTQSSDALPIKTAEEIFRENEAAVVRILSRPGPTGSSSYLPTEGTGFLISEDGYVLTSCSAVGYTTPAADKWDRTIQVTLSDGRELPAVLIAKDETSDLALLKLDEAGLPTVRPADGTGEPVGDRRIMIGRKLLGAQSGSKYDLAPFSGTLQSKSRQDDENGAELSFSDKDVSRKSTGGPLFDTQGRLTGVASCTQIGFTILSDADSANIHVFSYDDSSDSLSFTVTAEQVYRVRVVPIEDVARFVEYSLGTQSPWYP